MKSLRNKAYQLLRRSEAFFKTDMVYLARGSVLLTVGQALTSLSSFGLALLFARFVSKDTYGTYKYILSLAGLATTFSLTGLSTGVLQAVARGYEGTFIQAVKLSIKWNSLIFAAATVGALYYIHHGNTTIGYSLIVVAVFYPVIKSSEIYEAFLTGKKDFTRSALYRGIVDIGSIVATAVTILFTDNPIILISANILSQVVLNMIFFSKIYSSIPEENKHRVEPGVISFTKHLSVQNVLSNLATNLDKIVIFHFLGAANVAIYTFAAALPQQIRGLISNVTLVITPKIANRSAKESITMVPRRFLLSLLFLLPVVILYIVFAPFLFKIFFPAYMDAVPFTRVYALTLLVLGNLSGIIITTQKAIHEQYIITLSSSIVQIFLILVLVGPFKIYGVISAIVITKFIIATVSYTLARRLAYKEI